VWRDGVDKAAAAAQGGGIADGVGPKEPITAQTQSHSPKMLQAWARTRRENCKWIINGSRKSRE
jgi:hypothetical protein